jgi:clan AA aspartic protease
VISGAITSDREARIEREIVGQGDVRQRVTFTIDTGFNGFLTLPVALVTALNLPLIGSRRATLGDGSIVSFDTLLASVVWDGVEREALALQSDVAPVIGMALLHGNRVTMDVIDGGGVNIETISV